MANEQTIGSFSHGFPHDVSDYPLMTLGMEVPESFLNEEIEFGKKIGEYFYLSDLANMWCDVKFVRALVRHPEAIAPLKAAARRFNIQIQSVKLRDWFHFLDATILYLWENNLDTVENLITQQGRRLLPRPSDVVMNDLNSAFRSIYGVGLNLRVA